MKKEKRNRSTGVPPILERADGLLCEIAETEENIKYLMEAYEIEKKRLDESYAAKIAPFEADRDQYKKDLVALMKKNKEEIFQDGNLVYLKHGSLIHDISHPVAFPRSHDPLIALLEAGGFTDVVKIKKSLDKDAIEKWTDAQLALVGLTRKELEEFKYDLKKEKMKC